MLPNAWWWSPRLLFRFLGAKKAVLLLGGIVGMGIAILSFPPGPEPAPVPFPAANREVAWVRALAFAGDFLIVATGGGPVHQDEMVGLRLWDAASGQQRAVLTGHTGGIVAVAFAPDGRLVASAGYDRTLRLWDVATGRQQAVLQRTQTVFHPLAFDPAGGLAWLENGFVQHWDPITGAVRVAPRKAVGEALSMAFAPDGRLLVTAGTDVTGFATRLWELPAGRLRAVLPGGSYSIACVATSSSGHLLATGDLGGGLQLWNTNTSQRIRSLPELRTTVRALAFSADDSSLAGADVEGTVKVWDIATGSERETFTTRRFSHEKE